VTLKPLGNWVAVLPEREEQEKVGAIYLPETCNLPVCLGRVVAKGPGPVLETGQRVPIDGIEPGDLVAYRGYHPQILPVDGVDHDFILSDFLDVVFAGEAAVPLNDRILVEVPEFGSGRAGSLALPESFLSAYYSSQVIAVGPGRRTADGGWASLGLEPGALVHYHRYSGLPIAYREQRFLVIRPGDVLAAEVAPLSLL
jgi:chaperonin GroES